jgi:plastocyanin
MLNMLATERFSFARISVRAMCVVTASLFAIGQVAVLALASENHRIVQKERAFQTKQIDIPKGDVLQFSNEDQFLHQIYIASDALDFDSAEQPPGETIAVRFPNPGTYEIRCHIHPRMLLVVSVR